MLDRPERAQRSDVLRDGLFAQIKVNHLGDEAKMALSSATPVPMALAERYLAVADHRQQTGDPPAASRIEGQRVDKLSDAPVDHVLPPRTAGGAHVNGVVF